jgi:uncharacterized protein YbjT (DUF2867 family)
MKKILVIGSTGMLGKPVTRALINDDFIVSVLARNVKRAQFNFPFTNVIEGDVFDPVSLAKAFEGQDAVYISLSPPRSSKKTDAMPEREGIDNIISVAQATGIKRIALLSSLVQNYNNTNDYNWWVFDIKQAAVNKVKASGIPYTIFYPSNFMENFDELLMKGNKIMLVSGSKMPMYFIAGEDYGKQVARSFSLLSTENKEYAVQGTEPYTWDEGAAIFVKNYKRDTLKIMKAPFGVLKFLGLFNTTIQHGSKIMEALNKYPEKFESDTTWSELGKPAITLKEYAAGI